MIGISEKFPDLEMIFNCIKCGNKFEFTDVNWENSPTIKWMKESISQNKSLNVENPEILKVVSEIT